MFPIRFGDGWSVTCWIFSISSGRAKFLGNGFPLRTQGGDCRVKTLQGPLFLNSMNILDNRKKILTLDSMGVLASIEKFPEQAKQVWEEIATLSIPRSYTNPDRVYICGMGGSMYAGRILEHLLGGEVAIPIHVVDGYRLPRSVTRRSLVLLSSYSGTTEEVLSCFKQAKELAARVLAITTGGTLGAVARASKIPAYIFTPTSNPSGMPRMGIIYMVLGVLLLLSRVGVVHMEEKEYQILIRVLAHYLRTWGAEVPTAKNYAKQIAIAAQNKILCLVGAEFLYGNVRAMTNQIDENGKQFACAFFLPEMNHHLLEGLQFPHTNPRTLFFLFFRSSLYHPRVRTRVTLTHEVIRKHGISSEMYTLQEKKKILQVLELLVFGSYMSFYLAVLHRIDPGHIPWVEYFKRRLSV